MSTPGPRHAARWRLRPRSGALRAWGYAQTGVVVGNAGVWLVRPYVEPWAIAMDTVTLLVCWYLVWLITETHGWLRRVGTNRIITIPEQSGPVYRCPRCEKISWTSSDVDYGWCGWCSAYTAEGMES